MRFETVTALQDWAEKLGSQLPGGTVLLVSGEMGVGKTSLAAALAKGLGIKTKVTSPTFSKLNIYNDHPWFMHLDLYNVKSPTEIEELGIYDYLNSPNGVCLIEWWDLYSDFFYGINSIQIDMKKENETRILKITKQENTNTAVLEFLLKSEDFHG